MRIQIGAKEVGRGWRRLPVMKRMMNRPNAGSRRIIESPSPIQSPSRLLLRSATAARRISTPILLMVQLLIASLAGCTALDRDASREASAAATEPLVHHYGLGTSPTAMELAAWDRDVRPDGLGLPSGSGTVPRGESLYEKQCQHCHGAEGQGGPFDRLAGRIPADAFPSCPFLCKRPNAMSEHRRGKRHFISARIRPQGGTNSLPMGLGAV